MKTKFIILILIVGLLSACGSQPAETPAAQPTEESVPTVEAPTNPPVPTVTAIPPTEAPTEQPTTEPAATTSVSFANDILPIIQSRCINCHGGNKIEEGLSMKTYANLMAGSDNGPVIVPGDAAELTGFRVSLLRKDALYDPSIRAKRDLIDTEEVRLSHIQLPYSLI